jgi:hypothetical protein
MSTLCEWRMWLLELWNERPSSGSSFVFLHEILLLIALRGSAAFIGSISPSQL